jgi:hypothetical protein
VRDAVQTILLQRQGERQDEIGQHRRNRKRRKAVAIETKFTEWIDFRSLPDLSTDDRCGRDKVGNVLVFRPSSPKVCCSGALSPNAASRNSDGLADTWAAAPPLVTSFGEDGG